MDRGFWTMVRNVLKNYFTEFNLGKKEAILGDINSKGDSIINTVMIMAKQFIWRRKFGSKTLDELSNILYMKNELNFLKEIKEFREKRLNFVLSGLIYFPMLMLKAIG